MAEERAGCCEAGEKTKGRPNPCHQSSMGQPRREDTACRAAVAGILTGLEGPCMVEDVVVQAKGHHLPSVDFVLPGVGCAR
eukprot:3584782-Rhodomonas_salina.1